MRQETGSSIESKTKDAISVRIHQNGDAFVLPEVLLGAKSTPNEERVLCVELLSKRTMLMPSSMLSLDDNLSAEEVCRREYAAGAMSIHDNEELLMVGEGEIVALVSLSKSLIAELEGRRAAHIIYTSPLLRERVSNEAHVIVDTVDGVSAIKVYSPQELLFADMFECSNTTQVAYWLDHLSQAMSLSNYDLYMLRGDATLLERVNSSFKQLRQCE